MGINFSSFRDKYQESEEVNDETLYRRNVRKAKEQMDAWERVQAIFETDLYGDISPDLHRIKDSTMLSMILGAIIGGISRSREAGERFMRQNAHEKFETPQYAQKAMQDKIMLGFGSGAFKVGWRLALFTFVYTMGTSCIAAYRGQHGILEHVGGAAAAGYLYKFKQGPKASLAGLAVGAGLGLSAGTLTYYGAKLADELSMSTVKTTDIGKITEGVKKHKIELNQGDFESLMPKAVAEAVKEVAGFLHKNSNAVL
ncbi:unnamed protein product [Allacma fusca]|uniref:Complex I assembly factor TIMMDC1, mitochondrial n=1 Tax=Allacma fusca TaxID=39272 RepID=A0A8J2LE56_9HEXA|nr:unnamed protein product [Allacma fusca]